jgi:hypothetical protein
MHAPGTVQMVFAVGPVMRTGPFGQRDMASTVRWTEGRGHRTGVPQWHESKATTGGSAPADRLCGSYVVASSLWRKGMPV